MKCVFLFVFIFIKLISLLNWNHQDPKSTENWDSGFLNSRPRFLYPANEVKGGGGILVSPCLLAYLPYVVKNRYT